MERKRHGPPGSIQAFRGVGFTGCGKSVLFCHSERCEESLFDLSPMKERFLGDKHASE